MGLPNNYENEDALAAGFGVHELNETWNNPTKNEDKDCLGQECPNIPQFSDTEGHNKGLFKTKMTVISTAECAETWKSERIYLSKWGMGWGINENLWSSKFNVVSTYST